MKLSDHHQLLEQLNWRYATKQFDPERKITAQDWATLEEALLLTPSSAGLQPWQFLVIDDPAVRTKLLLASYGQPQVVDASHLVVFAAKVKYAEADLDAHIRRSSEVRGISVESLSGLRNMGMNSVVNGMNETERRSWATNQTYIALGNLLTSAALLGIDACPMEGIERSRYDDILGLTNKGLHVTMIATLGYLGLPFTGGQVCDYTEGPLSSRTSSPSRVTRNDQRGDSIVSPNRNSNGMKAALIFITLRRINSQCEQFAEGEQDE